MKHKIGITVTLFLGSSAAAMIIFTVVLRALHSQWLTQFAVIVGAEELAARGYTAATGAFSDPTFWTFARNYILIVLCTSFFCGVCISVIYGMHVWRMCREESLLSECLDELLKNSVPNISDNSLLAEKQRQVLGSLSQQMTDTRREREEVQVLVNDISHQLKTPLSSIQLYLDLLEDDTLTTDERGECLSHLKEQTGKIGTLITALVQTARMETGMITVNMQPANLCTTVREAVADVAAKAFARHIAILSDDISPNGVLNVSHDATWTKEAVVNVLDNAIKYTPSGGTVHVNVQCGTMYVRVDIADNGPGIAPDEHQCIFSRFYRGTAALNTGVEGSGLGLYITRHIMRLQDGSVAVAALPSGGTCFTLFLQNR